SAISIIIVYLVGFPGGIIRRFLEHLLPVLASAGVTYTMINFGLIAVYFADSVWRWVRRARNLPLAPVIDLRTGKEVREPVDPKTLPSMSELISGDLIAGAGLALLLSVLFMPTVLGLFVHTIPPLSQCSGIPVSLSLTDCSQTGIDPRHTLTFVDQIQAASYFIVGALALALTAVLGGFGAVQGVPERAAPSSSLAQASQTADEGERAAATNIGENVAGTVLDTLRTALERRILLLFQSLARSLRTIGWPTLIFLATYGLFQLSLNLQSYLHADKSLHSIITYVLPAIGWGLMSVVAVVFSAALTVFRWHVVDNTFRFLGLVGFIVLLTFWIFSLALWGFNQLLLLTGASQRHPFDPPSWLTLISFAALLIFGAIFLFRAMRGPSAQTRAAANQLGATIAQRSQTTGGNLYTGSGESDSGQTSKTPVVNLADLQSGAPNTTGASETPPTQ
ncbi:MAG TPA: hypothetical protein VKQ36_08500, partial [Ktedonobacterales bacterium]|nr:hypothetical protein [Ktedonobacterales bacterium]